MPQKTWNAKRERQYEHIKESLLQRGEPEPLAEEIPRASSTRSKHNTASPWKPVLHRLMTCRPADAGACARTRGRAAEPCCSFATRPASAG